MGEKYRPNIAGILRDSKGKILVCERVDQKGAWQFPQGGIDKGESALMALYRELEEEIGVTRDFYEVVERRDGYRYKFADGRLKFGTYAGQEQTYFLCDFLGKKDRICIETGNPEFQGLSWLEPKDFQLDWVPQFKRGVYRQVFEDFFAVKLG